MPKPSQRLRGQQSGSFDLLAHAHFARTSDYLGRPALSPLSAQGVFPGGVMPRGSPIFNYMAAGLPRGPWQPNASTLGAVQPSSSAGVSFMRGDPSEPGKRRIPTATTPIQRDMHESTATPSPPLKSMSSRVDGIPEYIPPTRTVIMDTGTHESGGSRDSIRLGIGAAKGNCPKVGCCTVR